MVFLTKNLCGIRKKRQGHSDPASVFTGLDLYQVPFRGSAAPLMSRLEAISESS
jgi:hypothetical protein